MAAQEKEKEKAPSAAQAAPDGDPAAESAEKTKKKRSLVIIGGIAGLLLVVLGIGGFFVAKTLMAPKVEAAAKAGEHSKGEEKGKADEHGKGEEKGKADEHGKAEEKGKADEHGKGDEKGKAEEKPKADEQGKKDDGQSAAKSEAPADEKDTKERTTDIGESYEFPKMDLNLGNPLENRFLRMGMSIEYHGGEKQKEDLKKREPVLKDIVISAVSNKSRIDLLSEKGKEKLRRELTNRFNEVIERPIKAIYFTDFLVE